MKSCVAPNSWILIVDMCCVCVCALVSCCYVEYEAFEYFTLKALLSFQFAAVCVYVFVCVCVCE